MTLIELLKERARRAAKRGDEETLLLILDVLHRFADYVPSDSAAHDFVYGLMHTEVEPDLEEDE